MYHGSSAVIRDVIFEDNSPFSIRLKFEKYLSTKILIIKNKPI